MAVKPGMGRRVVQTIGSLKTGIVLLILVGILSALGTVILQRPLTEAEDMERAYSPQTLRVLDSLGLTDVYHSWYFIALMAVLCLSIVLVSLDRWPNAWRFYSRPYRRTDSAFRAVLPLQRSFRINDPEAALLSAERALKKHGIKPERIASNDEVSLYGEKSRYAVLAVYVVHASLLLILLGGIVDGLRGYKGYITLVAGAPAIDRIEVKNGTMRNLDFSLRCDEAGQENYSGEFSRVPKRWWSKLVVLENGREVKRQEIAVNDPLIYHGVRFYQSGFGISGNLQRARLAVVDPKNSTVRKVVEVTSAQPASLEDGTSIRMLRFIPDSYSMDGAIYQRSRDLGNSAAELQVRSSDGKERTVWMLRTRGSSMDGVTLAGPYDAKGNEISDLPYKFVVDAQMAPFTGLAVSHEPGQWSVWSGCVLMGIGLILAFWVLHQRYWVMPVTNKEGQLVLWFGAAANKNREGFEVRFRELADEIEKELAGQEAGELIEAHC